MIRVSFEDVFAHARKHLEDHQLRALDPKLPWWSIDGAFVCLSKRGRVVWLHWLISTGRGWRADATRILKAMAEFGADEVQFVTEEGSRIESVCKYFGGTSEVTDETYPNGKRVVACRIPTRTKR